MGDCCKEGGGLLQQRQIAARVFDWYSTNLMAPDGAMDNEHLASRIDEHSRTGSLTLFVRCNDPLSSYVSFLILFRFFERGRKLNGRKWMFVVVHSLGNL